MPDSFETQILITGATGFVGRALVRSLLHDGAPPATVRCLVRDRARAADLALPGGALFVGSLHDAEVLDRAVAGVRLVYHLAGATKALSRREFDRVNEDGTESLVAALARRAGNARLVHVSSLAAAGPSPDGSGSMSAPRACTPRSHYGESKRKGELRVEAIATRQGWVILRPGIVYGPGDSATRLLLRQVCAPLVVVPWRARPLSLIHVDDLVRAIRLAGDSEVERRIIPLEGPERLDTNALMVELAAACGRRPRVLRVPLWPAKLAARFVDLWSLARGRPGFFCADKLRDLSGSGWVADPAPARELLGFLPAVGITEGFRTTAEIEGFAPRGSRPGALAADRGRLS